MPDFSRPAIHPMPRPTLKPKACVLLAVAHTAAAAAAAAVCSLPELHAMHALL